MNPQLNYKCAKDWPCHAWLVRVSSNSDKIEVWHGRNVQIAEEWFCEAVWDGPFEEGGFDETDIVSGSGVRVRGEVVTFVSSGSTVDRLQYLEDGDTIWVSNSLACLLSQTGREVDVTYRSYIRAFNSIIRGLNHYQDWLPLDKGRAKFVYFNNLQWAGGEFHSVPKPGADRSFDSYEAYHGFLDDSFRRIAENMADSKRSLQYDMLGTLSTGYDSTTITALGQAHGLKEVLCFEGGGSRDLGSEIAHYLGVTPIILRGDKWLEAELPEVPFIAGDAFGEEVHYSAVHDKLRGRVILTGYHGDTVWDRDTSYVSDEIIRGDISGLSLTEYRLWAGFINCAVPFWGVRSLEDIRRISRSDEMKYWDVGGDYTRPICRRIVETAGVPREEFGARKSRASRWLVSAEESVTEGTRDDCQRFLAARRGQFWAHGRVPPGLSPKLSKYGLQFANFLGGVLVSTPGLFRLGLNHWPLVRGLVSLRIPNWPYTTFMVGYRRYLFPWAMSKAVQRYSRQV